MSRRRKMRHPTFCKRSVDRGGYEELCLPEAKEREAGRFATTI
jgi:hypothetical protein